MKYPFVKQYDSSDCAAACMAMICKYYKKDLSIAKLRDLMGTDMKGTNVLGLTQCATHLNLQAQALMVDREGFFSDFTLPAIANVIAKEGLSHFVVIYKITEQQVWVGDPAQGVEKLSAEDFLERYTGVMILIAPDSDFREEKAKKSNLLKQYIKLIEPLKGSFIIALIASFLGVCLGIVLSVFNNIIYDEVLANQQVDKLLIVMLAFLGFSVTATLISAGKKWVLLRLSLKIDWPLMMGYFEHIFYLPMNFFRTRKIGEITTRVSDAYVIKNVFNSIALSAVMDVVMMVFSGVMLCRMNPELFLINLFMIALCAVLVYFFRQPYKRINEEQMQQNALLNSEIIEGLTAIETIKANTLETTEMSTIGDKYKKALKTTYREGMLSNVQGVIMNVISQMGNIVMLYVGMCQIISGEITLGSYMAFVSLAAYFSTPMNNLVGMQMSLQEANISMSRLSEIMEYERENGDGQEEQEVLEGDVVLDHVSFRYSMREPVLKDVSLVIPKGKKIALVGPSGCGKTTLISLLMKYYTPETGHIFVGGRDLAECSGKTVRRSMSYVPQNIELFSKKILDNILVGNPDASCEEVVNAARMAGADLFIDCLPLGYETYLEEAGRGLSGGEKQRIALARAFLKDAPFYILDESTSNLDLETENIILDTIYHRLQNKTMLVVAHRLSTIKDCDKILFMEQGTVVEEGTHSELLAKRGRYFWLWEMQQGHKEV